MNFVAVVEIRPVDGDVEETKLLVWTLRGSIQRNCNSIIHFSSTNSKRIMFAVLPKPELSVLKHLSAAVVFCVSVEVHKK